MIIPPPVPAQPHREFSFNAKDFERVRDLIRRTAGIVLNDSKYDMVYGRLVRRLRFHQLSSFDAYLQILEREPQEFEAFVNALTTNLTSFFREGHHFPIFAEYLKAHRRTGEFITVWCAASSTGEEPYSLAMTAAEVFDSLNPPVRIVASDIDTTVLDTAKLGCYDADKVEKLTQTQRQRFFKPEPDGRYRVREELRQLISFRRVNLIEPGWPLRAPLDVIFCRNVMIYFDRDTQMAILRRFAPLLRADGLLFVGHSENFFHASDIFTLQGKTVYSLTRGQVKP